jgi:hypothetical protein
MPLDRPHLADVGFPSESETGIRLSSIDAFAYPNHILVEVSRNVSEVAKDEGSVHVEATRNDVAGILAGELFVFGDILIAFANEILLIWFKLVYNREECVY